MPDFLEFPAAAPLSAPIEAPTDSEQQHKKENAPPAAPIASDPADGRAGMVDYAREHLGEKDWAPKEPLLFGNTSYYCNQFVADVAREAGTATWDRIPPAGVLHTARDPLAKEWGDPNFVIKGWTVIFHPGMDTSKMTAKHILELRRPGDVVSGGGHMGIVSDEPASFLGRTFSAGALNKKQIVENDWSFRMPDQNNFKSAEEYEKAAKEQVQRFTVRRFVGLGHK